jgi:hypothetical protein
MNSYVKNYSEGVSDWKSVDKKVKKGKNKTPNPEMKRPRSTSTSKIKKDERPSTANSRVKRKPSPRVGDRTPPARPKEKEFRFNSPASDKKKIKQVKVPQVPHVQESVEERIELKKSSSGDSEVDQNIVISSYELYGIHSDEDSQSSENSQIDSTGGKLALEPAVISATGGNSCVYKGIESKGFKGN